MALFEHSGIVPKGEKISVTVEESLEDLVVVSFATGSRTLRGVLLDTEKKFQQASDNTLFSPYKSAFSGVATTGESSSTLTKTVAGRGVRGASQAASCRAPHVSSKKRGRSALVGSSSKMMKSSAGERQPVSSLSAKEQVEEESRCVDAGQRSTSHSPSEVADEQTSGATAVKRAGASASLTHLQLARGGNHQAKLNAQAAKLALAQAKLKRQKIRYHCVGPNRRRRILRRRAMAARSSSEREDHEASSTGENHLKELVTDESSRSEKSVPSRPTGPRLRGAGLRGSAHGIRRSSRGRGSRHASPVQGEGRASRRTAALPIGVDNLDNSLVLSTLSQHPSSSSSHHPMLLLRKSPERPSTPIVTTNDNEGLDMPLSPVLSFHKQAFIVGDVVWAKMVDLPWWPAVVESVRPAGSGSGSTMQDLSLQFLGRRGTSQTTLLPNTLVMPFVQAFRSKFLPSKKTSTYVRAVQEACEMTDFEPPPGRKSTKQEEKEPRERGILDHMESVSPSPANSPLRENSFNPTATGNKLSMTDERQANCPGHSEAESLPVTVEGENPVAEPTTTDSVELVSEKRLPDQNVNTIDSLSSRLVDNQSPSTREASQSPDDSTDSTGSDDDTIQVLEL